jgi:hypothetical protein
MSRGRQIKKFGRQVEAFLSGGVGRHVCRKQFEKAIRALDAYYPWGRAAERELKRTLPTLRKYASYRAWRRDQKGIPELDVARDMARALEGDRDLALTDLRLSEKDPPDVVALDVSGRMAAIEVTELVDPKAVRLNEAGHSCYRDWSMPEVVARVEELIRQKDGKTLHGGPYGRVIVAVHTDEPAIQWAEVRDALSTHRIEGVSQVTAAYLVFSWDPATQSCPVVRIPLSAGSGGLA